MDNKNKTIGSLWERTSEKSGEKYLSGIINDQGVVGFYNKNKKTDKSPDIIFKVREKSQNREVSEDDTKE